MPVIAPHRDTRDGVHEARFVSLELLHDSHAQELIEDGCNEVLSILGAEDL
ncbi:MAG: hypothetical protein QF515_18800 [Pseudomonadales bacterium]|nr:hypothetical protein [Pseudomonadales bacterium]MDP6829140.1 hypothetical protein [Pseudomonadales bacterium]